MESLLLSYARDLDDAYPGYEFSIWSREQLLQYFNEALCLIAAHRPDLFIENKVIKVDPCSPFLDTCDCNKVLDVLGQSDKHGNHIRPLIYRSQKGSAWQGKRKQGRFETQITDVEIVAGSNNLVRIYPDNLDPDLDVYVVVRCVTDPKHYSLEDEPPSDKCAYMAAARHWVLYNAKMVDGEFSSAMMTSAREHREMFSAILQLVKTADKEYDKELRDRTNPRIKS